MPLYELFCIAVKTTESAPLRDLIRTSSKLIIDHGGAVRGMQYWGLRTLPQRARRHQQWYTEGDHFFLQFDTNPRVLSALNLRLQSDPRVIRCTTLKLGDKLEQITPRGVHGDSNATLSGHTTHLGGGVTLTSGDLRSSRS